ncbi:hypothetical protein PS1_002458 [Malus domestica]
MLTTLLSFKDDVDGEGTKLTDTEIKYVEEAIFKVLRAVAVSGSTTSTAYTFRSCIHFSPICSYFLSDQTNGDGHHSKLSTSREKQRQRCKTTEKRRKAKIFL